MAAQAGLCVAWSETPEDTFCRVVAHGNFNIVTPAGVCHFLARVSYTEIPVRYAKLNEPYHAKTCLREFQAGKIQTRLLNYRRWLES